MLKNKLTLITILTILILSLTIPFVRAEDEPTDATSTTEDTIMPINESPVEQPADSSELAPIDR